MTEAILRGLKGLRLPVRHQIEGELAITLLRALADLGVDQSESSTWIAKEHDWLKDGGEASPEFRIVVAAVLTAAAGLEDEATRAPTLALADGYFQIYDRLRKEHAYTHEAALAVLGYSLLVIDLAVHDRMSAAQTAKVLGGLSPGLQFSRQAVKTVTSQLGCAISFDVSQVEIIVAGDAASEQELLADASLVDAIDLVVMTAERLGVRADLTPALTILSPVMQGNQIRSEATPYLQMLHYQCVVCELCDHSPIDIYEFSPRGANAEAVLSLYPESIAGAGNPFLNNAKSVEVIDDSWVRSKKIRDRAKARSLLMLLEALESLGFAARRELASWLRMWLSRILRISKENAYSVPRPLLEDDFARLLEAVGRGETKSFGIIEQRVVDFAASMKHVGLPARGLGDSVNATNRSSSKFGDCEFADASSFTIFAYEAHAGHLSRWYVIEHLRTLRRSIALRRQELELLSGGQGWSLRLTFVAHSFDAIEYSSVQLDGMHVVIEVVAFDDLFRDVDFRASAADFDELVTARIWGARTPFNVRRKMLKLAFPGERVAALDAGNGYVAPLVDP